MRPDLQQPPVSEHAAHKMSELHGSTVAEVRAALDAHDVVVVGMAQNPHVRRARKALDTAGIAFHYLEYGSYLSQWKPRLAIKLWSGWPTFPQVFVKGVLVGGANAVEKGLADGWFRERLAGERAAS